jgi:hypothetical protein
MTRSQNRKTRVLGLDRSLSRTETPGQTAQGTCPTAHGLFETQYPTGLPSSLTEAEEDDIIHAFRKLLAS